MAKSQDSSSNRTWLDVGASFADWLVGGDGFGIGVSQDASPFTSDQTLILKKAFEASTLALVVELAKKFQEIEQRLDAVGEFVAHNESNDLSQVRAIAADQSRTAPCPNATASGALASAAVEGPSARTLRRRKLRRLQADRVQQLCMMVDLQFRGVRNRVEHLEAGKLSKITYSRDS